MPWSSVCDDAGFRLFAPQLPIETIGQTVLAQVPTLISDLLLFLLSAFVLAQLIEDLSDNELIKKCLERSENWNNIWKEFENRFGEFILVMISFELRKHWSSSQIYQFKEAVKDIQQDVYAKLLKEGGKALKNFKGKHPESFKAYLKIITINLTKNFTKNEKMIKSHVPGRVSATGHYEPDEKDPVADSAEYGSDEKNIKENIIQVLTDHYDSRSKERDLAIFILYFFDGRSSHEIQIIIDSDLSVSGIETIISRTKLTLEKVLLA